MAEYIDEQFWQESLREPDWYLRLADDFKRLEKLAEAEQDPAKHKQIKREAYGIVEATLTAGTIPLASSGENLDKERQPIDTVVIHHTKNEPGMTLERLNAMQLLRVYGMYYANPTDPREQHFKGQPVWSNHFCHDQQVFWVYHWFVRQDGTAEQLLDDKYIGWQAGNWDVNTRSVAICIDDDLTNSEPGTRVIEAISDIIRENYSDMPVRSIVGHCEVSGKTKCPGDLFIPSWKGKLLNLLAGS